MRAGPVAPSRSPWNVEEEQEANCHDGADECNLRKHSAQSVKDPFARIPHLPRPLEPELPADFTCAPKGASVFTGAGAFFGFRCSRLLRFWPLAIGSLPETRSKPGAGSTLDPDNADPGEVAGRGSLTPRNSHLGQIHGIERPDCVPNETHRIAIATNGEASP